jgi:hypothetical protein
VTQHPSRSSYVFQPPVDLGVNREEVVPLVRTLLAWGRLWCTSARGRAVEAVDGAHVLALRDADVVTVVRGRAGAV